MRIEPDLFDEILARITPHIQKQDTFWRKAIEPSVKLAVTLRFLASGCSYKSLSYHFRVAHNTICQFVPEVCEAIFSEYASEVVVCPRTPEEWLRVAEGFESKWNLPHCIGSIDGKHVAIRCPPRGGSLYFNYKHFHSIVLLALVDADYRFLFAEVGATGAGSDGGVFARSLLREMLDEESIGLPPPSPLPGSDVPMPYYIVGDDAFPMRPWLMKPIGARQLTKEQRIYNYRISRARRVVENAFGILVARCVNISQNLPFQMQCYMLQILQI